MEEPRRAELHRSKLHRWRRQWPKKDQKLGGVKVKWTQRVAERPATHLLSFNPSEKGHMMNIHLRLR